MMHSAKCYNLEKEKEKMEYLDIVDENGNPTGRVCSRADAHAHGLPHHTSHVWIARRRGQGFELLLQKRSMEKRSFPGCYDSSSAGHIPAGGEYVSSALRELEEELGLSVGPEELIPCGFIRTHVDRIFRGEPFRDNEYSRIFLLLADPDLSSLKLQKEEVESVVWMELQALIRAVSDNTIPHCIAPEELRLVETALRDV